MELPECRAARSKWVGVYCDQPQGHRGPHKDYFWDVVNGGHKHEWKDDDDES